MDPYLWIPSGRLPYEVALRFVLLEDADHERLLAAFKRPPEWMGATEEFFLAARQARESGHRRDIARDRWLPYEITIKSFKIPIKYDQRIATISI